MTTIRDILKRYLLTGFCNSVTGDNDKTVQYQGDEEDRKIYALYNENGDWEGEVSDIEIALDYIGA